MSGAPFFKTARVSDEAMPVKEVTVVYFDPGILGCTPMFVGTRAPVQAPIDYIESGHSLKELLDDFPTASWELAIECARWELSHS